MVIGTLFTYPDNFRAQLALTAAKYNGIEITVARKDLREPDSLQAGRSSGVGQLGQETNLIAQASSKGFINRRMAHTFTGPVVTEMPDSIAEVALPSVGEDLSKLERERV